MMKVHILNANFEECFNKISTGVHMYIKLEHFLSTKSNVYFFAY